MVFPDWVLKHKKRGYEIKCIDNNYYMYKMKSKWDPEKKRAKKVSGEYIGKVTPEGIVTKRAYIKNDTKIYSYEYGATKFCTDLSKDIYKLLCDNFSKEEADFIYVSAIIRLIYSCSYSRISNLYQKSWISKLIQAVKLAPATITKQLNSIGSNRSSCAKFMRESMNESSYIIIDGTRIVSASDGIYKAVPGHSHTHSYLPQINQIYIMGITDKELGGMPMFYRNVAGNIPDIKALKMTLEDAKVSKAIFIADNGFASIENFELLKDANLEYILPLKRNSREVDLEKIEYKEVFPYQERAIFAHFEDKNEYKIYVFRDEYLKARETSDHLKRIIKSNETIKSKKAYNKEIDLLRDASGETIENVHLFGTIIIRTNLNNSSCQEIYEIYKMRWQIEQMFDTWRNDCDGDASYMHNDIAFEAWSFIGHISLTIACRILSLLKQKNLLKNWSLRGVLETTSNIRKVLINDQWIDAETTKKDKDLLKKLGLNHEKI